jgi:hypothetical protein
MKVASMLAQKLKKLFAPLKTVLVEPNAKQREAYGRIFHNLTVACVIGAVSLGYSAPPAGETYVWRIVELVALAGVFFVVGGFLSKGE